MAAPRRRQSRGGNMTDLGLYLAVDSWANWEGSHIPKDRWAQYPYLINQWLEPGVYILWPDRQTQFEDLRRLRHDAGLDGLGFDNLIMRLGWEYGKPFSEPTDFLKHFQAQLLYAQTQGYKRLFVVLANEPNNELKGVWSPSQFLAWYKAVLVAWRADAQLKAIPVIAPAIAGYNDNSWAWWDGALRECCALSDLANVHLYPTNEAELQGGWSLPWWQGQVGPEKRIVICEAGCRTGTPQATRDALLPKLYRQVKACAQVDYAAAFVQWTQGQEHAEHWLTPAHYYALLQANMGAVQPPSPPEPPQPPADLAGQWVLSIGGVEIPFSVRRA